MSNTIKTFYVEFFILLDSVSQAYKRDINHYKELIKQINTAIEQKEKTLQRFNKIFISHKKEIGTRKDRNDDAPESIDASGAVEESIRNKNAEATAQTKIMCQYHPQAPAVDKKRQICSSCKWKLVANGLLEHYNDPAVVAYLKGESTSIPDMGQAMCPLHPTIPSYNKKTGLCRVCHRKARVIGVTDRKLDDEELEMVRRQGEP